MTFTFTTPVPSLDMTAAAFDAACETMVAELQPFATAMNDISAAAAASANTAIGAANFKGAWSGLTGALEVPASVSHAGKVWLLLADLANVATATPGVSGSWQQIHPLQPLTRSHIFAASTVPWRGGSSGETLHSTLSDTGIAATAVVGGITTLVAADMATARTQVAHSYDGSTWTLPTMPANRQWLPLFDGTHFVALASAGSATTRMARSTDGGLTWAYAGNFGTNLPVAASATEERHAAGGGKIVVWTTADTIKVSTDSGSNWTADQTAPSTAVTRLWVLDSGTAVAHQAGATGSYYTSPTALTGSWTTRTMPAGCDTIVQDFDRALLAYKAGSHLVTIKRSTDGGAWTDTGVRLWQPSASVRSINGVYINGAGGGGGAMATRHADWVPRNSAVGLVANKFSASRAGVLLNLLCGGGVVAGWSTDTSQPPQALFAE
jgi:hypothetical protein